MVFPVVLGSGKRLFGDTRVLPGFAQALDAKPAGECMILVYEPAGDGE